MSAGFLTITAWIVLTSTGIVLSAFNLYDAHLDRLALKERQLVNGRLLVAKVSLITEVTRLIAHILLLVAGVLIASVQFSPDPPPASLYVRSVILLTIALLVSHTILARWLRRRLTAKDY